MNDSLQKFGFVLGRTAKVAVHYRSVVLVMAIVIGGTAITYIRGNLGVNTDTANMISSELPWRQDFDAYRENFPIRDRNLVIVVDSLNGLVNPNAIRLAAEELTALLQLNSNLFPEVFLAGNGEFFERNGLLFLSEEELEELTDRLATAQPLIGQLRVDPTGASMLEITERILSEPNGSIDFADGFVTEVATVVGAHAAGRESTFDWGGLIQGTQSATLRQLILIQPKLDFSRMRPARDAIEEIRELIANLQSATSADIRIRVTGTLAMEHEELDSVISSASIAGALALLMVAVVLYWALRSVRLLVISLISLLFGLLGTAACAALLVGQLNLLSVAFAVLYVGLGVDFILHITLRVKESLGDGLEIDDAIEHALREVGGSLVVCTLTTAAGFYAFVPTPFEGVSELGLISGTGMFVSFIVSVTVLPALLSLGYRTRHRALEPSHAIHLRSLAAVRPSAIVVVGCVVVVLAGISLPWLSFDSNPINLRDQNSESVMTLRELAGTEDAAVLTMVALARNSSEAQTWTAELSSLAEVQQIVTVDSLVPSGQQEKLFLIEDLALVLGPGFADFSVANDDPARVGALLNRIVNRLQEREALSESERRLLTASQSMISAVSENSRSYGELGLALITGLPAELQSLATRLTARSFGRDDLPGELRSRWLTQDGIELIEIVPSENVTDTITAGRFVDATRAVVPSATGLPVVYREAGATVVTSFRLALIYAVVLVSLLLIVFLRNLADCAFVLIPILCAAIVTAGITVWISVPFNFANIIALPLLVGVGVDNAIHMVHRLRSDRLGSESALRTSTSAAVLASGLTTIASFGNLAFSTHRGMATMGILLTVGMLMTMIATLIFLPALLTLKRVP